MIWKSIKFILAIDEPIGAIKNKQLHYLIAELQRMLFLCLSFHQERTNRFWAAKTHETKGAYRSSIFQEWFAFGRPAA